MTDKPNSGHGVDLDDSGPVDAGPLRQRCQGGNDTDSKASSLPDGTIFDILRNDRRRAALLVLSDAEEVSVSLLAEQVAAIENDTTRAGLTEQQRKRVYVSLHQSHLPKMDGLGIVEFDRDAARVSLGPTGGEVLRYVGGDPTARRWYRYYAAIAVLGAGLLLAQVLLVPNISPTIVTVVLLLAVALCTAVYWACDGR